MRVTGAVETFFMCILYQQIALLDVTSQRRNVHQGPALPPASPGCAQTGWDGMATSWPPPSARRNRAFRGVLATAWSRPTQGPVAFARGRSRGKVLPAVSWLMLLSL